MATNKQGQSVPAVQPDEPEETTPDFKMQPSELAELHASAKAIGQQDHRLGHLLAGIITHLGHAHGLETPAPTPAQVEETTND